MTTTKRKPAGKPWQPGQSGNPAGKPKGTRNPVLAALDAVGEANAKAILERTVTAALTGDIRAADSILSRVWPARKGRPINLTIGNVTTSAGVQSALSDVLQAMAAGQITTDEAAAVASLLETQRRAIETTELAERISALEARKP